MSIDAIDADATLGMSFHCSPYFFVVASKKIRGQTVREQPYLIRFFIQDLRNNAIRLTTQSRSTGGAIAYMDLTSKIRLKPIGFGGQDLRVKGWPEMSQET